jgi:hypothetical protein
MVEDDGDKARVILLPEAVGASGREEVVAGRRGAKN